MAYCIAGEKARINFRFGDGSEDQVEMLGPIEVATLQGGLVFRANAGNLCRYTPENWVEVVFLLQPIPALLETAHPIPDFCQGVENPVSWVNYQIPALGFDAVAAFPGSGFQPGSGTLTVRLCKITITNAEGATVEREGECPLSFTVACGDGCPPDHLRCESDSYPGYCCIPCAEVAAELRAIKEAVKNV